MLLNGEWKCLLFREGSAPQTFSAAVPGCIHTDLKRAGVIGDYFYRNNAEKISVKLNCQAFSAACVPKKLKLCCHHRR